MPKLTLRDLFAVVTIVALALGWGLDHWRLVKESQRESELRNAELRKAEKQLRDAIQLAELLKRLVESTEFRERDQPTPSN